jgi:hypothetical protein
MVRTYGDIGLVKIASNAREFCEFAEHLLAQNMALKWRGRVDRFLSSSSWDATWASMDSLIRGAKPTVKKYGAKEQLHVPTRMRDTVHV